MITLELDCFPISSQTELRVGDIFRATGGPYYRSPATGKRISLADRGVFRLIRICRRGACVWLDAIELRNERFVALQVSKRRRSRECPNVILEPYRVRKVKSYGEVVAR